MKIDDLILILNNRLREFQLSRDYAKMSGDLERMNTADKEIIGLEDTLYKLNLLADTTKSAAVKETTLTEVIADGSVAVLSDYDITPYATDPLHEEKVMNILSAMGVMDTVEKIDDYIHRKYSSSPVTGEMVMNAASAYDVDARLLMALMEQDSRFGTEGVAVRTLNPGNVGNDDSGNTRTYDSWQEGVTAVAEWLHRHRVSSMPSVLGETNLEPVATSTPATIASMEDTLPVNTSTSTTTTTIATSTPAAAISTGATATSTPATIASMEDTLPVNTSTSTTTLITSTSSPLASTAAN